MSLASGSTTLRLTIEHAEHQMATRLYQNNARFISASYRREVAAQDADHLEVTSSHWHSIS
jgi:hypothetical protein